MAGPTILGPDGKPLARPRASALAGESMTPWDGADVYGQHTAGWNPLLWSPDVEINQYRDRLVSRVRDLVRNDGWASGTVTRILDAAIGGEFRPVAKPDYRALAALSGNAGFDHVWADEFGRAVDAAWRTWADDPGRYCDAGRRLTFTQQARVAFRHKLVDGDALALVLWLPERMGPGRARYATSLQLIDPDRLSNPAQAYDTETCRGGVEIDRYGAAVAYHIRRAHQGDWFAAAQAVSWERVAREDEFGRARVVHDFEHDRAGQHRGGAGIFTPVLTRLKMLIKYDSTELDAAIINALLAAYIESPFDPALVGEALGEGEGLSAYQEQRAGFHQERGLRLNGARIPTLFPGEKINAVAASRPVSNFADFESAVLRNVAAGAGVAEQTVSQDWSRTNYSSARAALLEAWKTMSRRRADFGAGFASPARTAWLEEEFDRAELPLPGGEVPDFIEARGAYSRCRWMGPGRGWVDPTAEKTGSVIGMDAGLSTLEMEAAENVGVPWEELLEQRALELKRFDELGIPRPEWAGQLTATQAAKKPEAQ